MGNFIRKTGAAEAFMFAGDGSYTVQWIENHGGEAYYRPRQEATGEKQGDNYTPEAPAHIVLTTPEGRKFVNLGDYIVRENGDQFRAYTPESFRATFDEL